MQPLKILLVEDHAGSRHIFRRLLELCGHRVVEAADGKLALEALSQQQVDLILSDINMPEMDGMELARRVRQHPALSQLGLVALTAFDQPTILDEIRQVGFEEVCIKPIELKQLEHAIERVRAKRIFPRRDVSQPRSVSESRLMSWSGDD